MKKGKIERIKPPYACFIMWDKNNRMMEVNVSNCKSVAACIRTVLDQMKRLNIPFCNADIFSVGERKGVLKFPSLRRKTDVRDRYC